MKKLLISLITIAMLAIPVGAFAGTAVSFGFSSHSGYHGGSSVHFGISSHSGYHHRHVRTRTIVRGGGHIRYHHVRPAPRVVHHYHHRVPYYGSYTHRQEGRVYVEEPCDNRTVIVVPSGRRVVYRSY